MRSRRRSSALIVAMTAGATTTARAIDMESLLPDESAVFRYAGSLTTPPCSEIVNWVVYERPVEVSAQQLAIFEGLYPNSNRPIQPTNRRLVLIGD